MEIEGENGSKTHLKKGSKTELGRGLGFDSVDRTVSRRHVSFEPTNKARVPFEVIGKNPIWVKSSRSDEIKVFRRFEGGEMEDGDMFCVSARKPSWFTARRLGFEREEEGGLERELGNESELDEGLQSQSRCGVRSVGDLELDSVDVSGLDPVKEFGFLVMGQEFNHYPKQIIRHVKTWNWFLEEPNEDSEDDEISNKKGKKGLRRKRKNDEGNDDDEWTGESEEDKEALTKVRKVQNPKYSTRSKDHNKPTKDTRIDKHSVKKKTVYTNEEDEDDEDDDTLGGFIVENDDTEEEEEVDQEEEEEDLDEDDE